VSGVHVIQRLTPGNDVVAVNLYLLGGVMQLTPATAGVEDLALGAADYGSQHYSGSSSRRAMALTGSRYQIRADADWSAVSVVGLADVFDSTWAVFADRIVHPTLDSTSIELVRTRMLRNLRLRSLSPEGTARILADSLAFLNHPYGLHPFGSEVSLAQLTPAIVRSYVHDQFVTSRMLLVVVGNIPRAHLEPLVGSTLGTLSPGHYVRMLPPAVPRRPTALTIVSKPSATNYIVGVYPGPSIDSPDYPGFELTVRLLGGMLNNAIRLRASLSYAASAPYEARAVASGGLYASTTSPTLVVALMRQTLDNLKAREFDFWALGNFEKEFRGQYLLRGETNEAQANVLGRAQIFFGDYRKAADELKRLRNVTPFAVRRIAQTYLRDIQFVYVGDTAQVRPGWVASM